MGEGRVAVSFSLFIDEKRYQQFFWRLRFKLLTLDRVSTYSILAYRVWELLAGIIMLGLSIVSIFAK